jgi:rubrerythrin
MASQLVDDLDALLQLDEDAVEAYKIAIDKLRDAGARGDLVELKQDHARHIEDLARVVLRLGGTPMQNDHGGVLADALAAVRAASGDVSALRAMRMVERVTNRTYGRILAHRLDAETRAIVLAHRDDERQHLREIKSRLESLDEAFQEEIDDEEQLLREEPEAEQPAMGL